MLPVLMGQLKKPNKIVASEHKEHTWFSIQNINLLFIDPIQNRHANTYSGGKKI